jgi:hypothetical protein
MTIMDFFFNFHNNVTDSYFNKLFAVCAGAVSCLKYVVPVSATLIVVASVFGFNNSGFIGILFTCPQMDLLPV